MSELIVRKLEIDLSQGFGRHWLGDGLLRHDRWLDDAEPHMRTLWEWHAADETEHKAVAFDACQAIRGKEPSLAYLRPSFHPWQDANAKLAEQWLARNDASIRPVSTTAPTTGSYALDMTKDAAVMS